MVKRLPLNRRSRHGYSRLAYILGELLAHIDADPTAMPKVRVEALRAFAQSEREVASTEYHRYHIAVMQYQSEGEGVNHG